METSTCIYFGDFNEHERLLYFSEESVRSSAIEFPEEFLNFDGKDEGFIADVKSSVRAADGVKCDISHPTESFPRESVIDPRDEVAVSFDKTHLEASDVELHTRNQVSEKYDVETVCNENEPSDLPGPNSNADLPVGLSLQYVEKSSDGEIEVDLELPNVAGDKSPTDAVSEEKASVVTDMVSCGGGSSPAEVAIVKTRTMLTTSTKTVESSHETVKSTWADLFKTKSRPSSKPQGSLLPPPPPSPVLPQQPDVDILTERRANQKDSLRHYLIDVLKKVELSNQVPHLQPRGLKNNANWCYINATLQVLIFCPSFYHFLMNFKLKTDRGISSTPILDALVSFASEFNKMAPWSASGKSQEWGKPEVIMGMPFEPTYVYEVLQQIKTTLSKQGKQEDAEEFLSCILNGLHEEMVQLATPADKHEPGKYTNHSGEVDGVEDWEQVGPRNRSTVTRKSTMAKSPVAEIFGGYLRSSLLQHGMKESASIQPFFTIQLDLRGEVTTVQQAFDNFFRVEEVEGFQCDKSKAEVEVSKRWTLDTLPIVLVLHLKRFVLGKNGCEKLTKKITYDSHLRVPPDTLSKVLRIRNKNLLTYKLFAITYHHGKNLNGGHYTSDIFHPAVGWLRADDINVRTIPTKFVFNPLSNRDPYLLYFSRGDIST